ncbi:unnamed protein product [Caenorhabditis bovis]|uniref:Glutaredoxin domain-containing protein n=1 Tax=Caenorhabditis bovis TaxID=2654633 RepID=A0A8S1EVN9_9PELO|nr:unnamed protein product [Caenorhabditis bovis]
MAPLKVYVASATANPETKYRVQRTLMILDGLGIPFDSIDITKPEKAEERKFMRENATKSGPILPPQFFYNDEYLGDYEDFDTAVETDTIVDFLRLLPETLASNADTNENGKNEEETAVEATTTAKTGSSDEQLGEDEEWDEDEEEDEEEEKAPEPDPGPSDNKEEKVEDEAEVAETATISLPKPASPDEYDVDGEDEELEGEDEEWDEDEEEEEA